MWLYVEGFSWAMAQSVWKCILLGLESKGCPDKKQYREVCYWHWRNDASYSFLNVGCINPKH